MQLPQRWHILKTRVIVLEWHGTVGTVHEGAYTVIILVVDGNTDAANITDMTFYPLVKLCDLLFNRRACHFAIPDGARR